MALPKWMKPSMRQILSVMVFWGQIQNYMMRANLNILIVAMVRDTSTVGNLTNNSTVVNNEENDKCIINTSAPIKSDQNENNLTSETFETPDEVLFEWDALTRGLILSAFSYGYFTTQIIGGRLTEMFGVKKVYGLCLLATAILTLLSPITAKLHVGAFMALRGFQGVFEGVTFPALHAMAAKWIPPDERSSFIARSFFGTSIGVVVTYPLCGVLVASVGWEPTFYVIGCITIVWFVLWWVIVYDSPQQHPFISNSEREFIERSVAGVDSGNKLAVPWKRIATSIPFLGLMVTDSGNTWGLWTLSTNGPSYLKYMLGVDIKTNGLISGLPLLCRYFGGLFLSCIADWLQRRKILKVVWIRIIFNSISQCCPAVAMLMLAFALSDLRCSVPYTMGLLCIGMFFNGAISSGHFSSYIDLSPNFAGTLFGISNTFSGGATGFAVPALVGAITNQSLSFNSWKIVFGLASAIYFVGNLVYVFTISGDIQDWNSPKENSKINEEQNTEMADLNIRQTSD